jgi:hypothetical protein
MNHKRIHDQIIDRAKLRGLRKLELNTYDTHHIIPKCLGGTNDSNNLVLLTYKEHALIHLLLCYIYPEHNGILLAYIMMSGSNKYNISTIANLKNKNNKIASQKIVSEETKNKISKTLMGHIMTEKNRLNIITAKTGCKSWNSGIKCSAEYKKKLSDSHKGHIVSPETRAKLSLRNKGRIFTDEHKKKLSESKIGSKPDITKITCNHCNTTVANWIIKLYHGPLATRGNYKCKITGNWS